MIKCAREKFPNDESVDEFENKVNSLFPETESLGAEILEADEKPEPALSLANQPHLFVAHCALLDVAKVHKYIKNARDRKNLKISDYLQLFEAFGCDGLPKNDSVRKAYKTLFGEDFTVRQTFDRAVLEARWRDDERKYARCLDILRDDALAARLNGWLDKRIEEQKRKKAKA